MSRHAVLVAARPYDLSEARYDAFVTRHARLADALASRYDVSMVGLRVPPDNAEVARHFSAFPYYEVAVPKPPPNRLERLRRAARDVRGRPLDCWEEELAAVAERVRPRVVVTIGPWLEAEYRVLFDGYPTVHFFEEDVMRMRELAPQSPQARLLRRTEIAARRRATRPTATVVISGGERRAARIRFAGTSIIELPYSLNPEEWPVQETPSTGDHLLVVGRLTQPRNAEGLKDVLHHLRTTMLDKPVPVRLISADGLHPMLHPFIRLPWVEHAASDVDLWEAYRGARVVLVPARRATGLKTTVLQAWAAGCPVVCFPASAATLGATAAPALRVGRHAAEVVDHVTALWASEKERSRLADAGFAQLHNRFADDHHRGRVLTLVDQLCERPVSLGVGTPQHCAGA